MYVYNCVHILSLVVTVITSVISYIMHTTKGNRDVCFIHSHLFEGQQWSLHLIIVVTNGELNIIPFNVFILNQIILAYAHLHKDIKFCLLSWEDAVILKLANRVYSNWLLLKRKLMLIISLFESRSCDIIKPSTIIFIAKFPIGLFTTVDWPVYSENRYITYKSEVYIFLHNGYFAIGKHILKKFNFCRNIQALHLYWRKSRYLPYSKNYDYLVRSNDSWLYINKNGNQAYLRLRMVLLNKHSNWINH